MTGDQRFIFGRMDLADGFGLVPVLMGIFGISEILINLEGGVKQDVYETNIRNLLPNKQDWKSSIFPISRETVVGFMLGLLPGGGPTIASFASYAIEKKTSRHPKEFGTGIIEGVAGPEAANNAKEGGALIPTLAFGIPGSQGMAVMLGVFLMIGIVPGPEMVTEHLDIVFMLVFIVAIGNIFATGIGFLIANQLQKLTIIPGKQLVPIVLVICFLGSFITNERFSDIIVALIFTILGYFMKKYGYSRAAFIIAMILGTLFERYFHIAVRLYGSFFIFVRPISFILFVFLIVTVIIPFVQSKKKKNIGNNTL